ncbi:MAG: hypothetical protein H8K06_19535 [Nitrospira sp.]|nr:hypothetical protein [Nitrospira sp.]
MTITDAPLSLQHHRTVAVKLSDYIDHIFQCKGVSPRHERGTAPDKEPTKS